MNAIELALKKQLLLLEAAGQREELSRHAAGLQPVFHVVDRAQDGARWIGRHPEVVAGGVALLAAARPGVRRFLWRWGKRTFIGWQLLRESELWGRMPARPSGRLNSR